MVDNGLKVMNQKNKKWIWVIIGAFGIGLYFLEFGLKAENTAIPQGASESTSTATSVEPRKVQIDIEPVPVEVAVAKKQKLIQHVRATGYTEALREMSMISKQDGQITELPIRENMLVERDQLLLALNSDEQSQAFIDAKNLYTSKLSQYAVELGFDSSTSANILAKAEEHFQTSMAEELERVDHQTKNREADVSDKSTKYNRLWLIAGRVGLITAWTNLERARLTLEQTRLYAPFDGHIVDLKLAQGSWIKNGEEVLRLIDLDQVVVNSRVLESEMRHLNVGSPAQVIFVAYPDTVYTGTVDVIRSMVDPETGTCEVRILIDNPDFRLKPGMFANAQIAARVYNHRLVVRTDAILNRDERDVVFVVENGLAKWRYIASDLKNEIYTEILKGVQEGDSVIVSGHYNLAHDTPVAVVKTIEP